jgi:integrase
VKLPVVLTFAEVKRFFEYVNGNHRLAISILYGSGLRLMECVRLRVQDIDLIINHYEYGITKLTGQPS